MISARELRIGNWIRSYEHDGYVQVTLIAEDHLGVNRVTWDYPQYESFEPIPLSEEILLRCVLKPGIFSSNFTQDKDGYFLWVSGSKVYIKYLHQMQNLVYDLDGIELEVKL